MKFYITIFNRTNNCISHLERTKEDLNSTIVKELGGWNNLYGAMTSGIDRDYSKEEYFTAGTTKDNMFCYSILAIEVKELYNT